MEVRSQSKVIIMHWSNWPLSIFNPLSRVLGEVTDFHLCSDTNAKTTRKLRQ